MITLNEFSNLAKTNPMQVATEFSPPLLNKNSSSSQQIPLKTDTFENRSIKDKIEELKKKRKKRLIIKTTIYLAVIVVFISGKKIFKIINNIVENYKKNNNIYKIEIIPTPAKYNNPPIRREIPSPPKIIDVEGYSIK